MNFESSKSTERISEEAFKDAAQDLNCDIAAIKAVAEVESRGDGFLDDFRPTILFERHIFKRRTKGKYDGSNPDISGRSGGYKGGVKEYVRILEAMELDENAALESASWGKFQIMGFNHEDLGFQEVEEFVEAMVESEDRHLEAFIRFVEVNKLDHHLRSHDWSSFALGYNGPGYRKNNYHIKMARSYEKFSNSEKASSCAPSSIGQDGFTIGSVIELQTALDFLGFSPGEMDNKMGPKTREAIETFQRFANLPQSGEFESSVKSSIQSAYYMMKKFETLIDK